jgi:hypothetical protein
MLKYTPLAILLGYYLTKPYPILLVLAIAYLAILFVLHTLPKKEKPKYLAPPLRKKPIPKPQEESISFSYSSSTPKQWKSI